jgi:hypothetical protein
VSGSKEGDLVMAVLVYAIRCLGAGDHHALRAMNFGPREVEALRQMALPDLCRIGALGAHCLSIELDREVFWPMVEHLRREGRAEAAQRRLIEADAPLGMLRTLFGMGSREYTRSRELLGVAPSVGRPPEPDETVAHAVWAAWSKRRAQGGEHAQLLAEDYLAIHEETGSSLRAIWQLTQRWVEHGEPWARSARQGGAKPGETAARGQLHDVEAGRARAVGPAAS